MRGVDMQIAIWIVIGLLVITKFMDAYTTMRRIQGISHETNPVARKLMGRLGVKPAIWAIFGLAVVIIGLAGWLVLNLGVFFQVVFIVVGLLVVVVQAAAAQANWTGRQNAVTLWLLGMAGRVQVWLWNLKDKRWRDE